MREQRRDGRRRSGDRGRKMPVASRCRDSLQWQVQEVLPRARALNIHFQGVCA